MDSQGIGNHGEANVLVSDSSSLTHLHHSFHLGLNPIGGGGALRCLWCGGFMPKLLRRPWEGSLCCLFGSAVLGSQINEEDDQTMKILVCQWRGAFLGPNAPVNGSESPYGHY